MENYSKLSHKSQEILPAVDSNKKSHAVEQNSKFPQDEPNFDPEVATQAWETNILVPEDVLLEITTRLQNVEEQNREILSIVRDIKEDSNVVKPNSLFAPPQGYPLKTIEEFDSFENDINKVNALYSKLRKYGGTKLREALSFAFKASMTDELATKFTWYGESGETRNFGKTKMASILYQVVNKCKQFKGPNNSTEFKMEMTEVLRAAKQRHRNFCKKEQRPYKKRSRLDEQQRAHELFDFKENELEDDSNLEEDERSEMDSTNGSYEEDENDPLERELDSAGSFYEGDGEPMENSDERDKTD